MKNFFIGVLIVIFIGLISLAIFISIKINDFQKSSGVSFGGLVSKAVESWERPQLVTKQNDVLTFLILGTNEIPGRPVPPITDTMLGGSINFKTGRVGLFSIPRDIWSVPYATKIDALYTYGESRYPGKPEQFTDEVVGQMAGIYFDRTIVITPASFINIVDTLGGVDINVTHPFIDNQYPRMDVDVTRVTDPKLLYETIEFKSGWQHMDGGRSLEYVRSRHAEGPEGSDIARGARQREIINAITDKFKDLKFYLDAVRLGKLYKIYDTEFSRYINLSDLIAILKEVYPLRSKMSFVSSSPTIFPDSPNGSIYHPNFSPLNDGQWVYLIKDENKFKSEIQTTLGTSNK